MLTSSLHKHEGKKGPFLRAKYPPTGAMLVRRRVPKIGSLSFGRRKGNQAVALTLWTHPSGDLAATWGPQVWMLDVKQRLVSSCNAPDPSNKS